MRKRPTITDLARAAGVSVATVDRVLNSRSRVRESTAQRVLLAADEIGYHASTLLKQRYRESRPRKRVVILLQRSNEPFYQRVASALKLSSSHQAELQLEVDVTFMDEVSPDYIAARVVEEGQKADGLALVALDNHAVNQAIEELMAQGKPVITLISPLSTPSYTAHIGLDSRKAGRSAAWAISHLSKREGKVGILLGSHHYVNQEISEISFISYFRDLNKTFQLLEPELNLDDDDLAAEATARLLAEHPDMVAIYSAGGGVRGIVDTLRARGRGKDLVVICNELTETTRRALAEGIVDMALATPVERLARETIDIFVKTFTKKGQQRFQPLLLPVEIHIPENI